MASVAKRKWTSPNGTKREGWEVRYVNPSTGKRPSRTFELKKDADAFKRKVEREIEDGTHVADAETKTISATAREFLSWTEGRLDDGRIGRSRYNILELFVRKNLEPELGSFPIRDLAQVQVDAFYRTLAKRYTPTSARQRIENLKQIENFAIRRGYTKATPVAEAIKELRGLGRTRIRTFTAEEAATLLRVVRDPPPGKRFERMQAILACASHLAAFSGLRRGEIFALTIENVDLDRRIIAVRHNLTAWDELKAPKTASGVRDVPIPQHVVEMLRDWMRRFYVDNDRGLIFRGKSGAQILSPNFHLAWRRLLERAGLRRDHDPFHFHALRHFSASWMIHNGLPLTDVAALLGHSKFDMTLQVYAHPVVKPHLRHDAIERMVTQLPALPAA